MFGQGRGKKGDSKQLSRLKADLEELQRDLENKHRELEKKQKVLDDKQWELEKKQRSLDKKQEELDGKQENLKKEQKEFLEQQGSARDSSTDSGKDRLWHQIASILGGLAVVLAVVIGLYALVDNKLTTLGDSIHQGDLRAQALEHKIESCEEQLGKVSANQRQVEILSGKLERMASSLENLYYKPEPEIPKSGQEDSR